MNMPTTAASATGPAMSSSVPATPDGRQAVNRAGGSATASAMPTSSATTRVSVP